MKEAIIYIGGFELPDNNAAAHRVLNNGKLFRDLGYKVVFIDIDKETEFNDVVASKHDVFGFETYSLPYPKSWRSWFRHLVSSKELEDVASLYDNVALVVCYNHPAISLLGISRYCRRREIRTAADVTEWYAAEGGPVRRVLKGLDTFLRMRIVHKRLDGLIVISQYLREYYRKCPNLVVLPPLVDLEESKWDSLERAETASGRLSFVYSGSPGASKDKLGTVIHCFYTLREYDNFILDVAGVAKDEYLERNPEQRRQVEELSGCVNFHGRLDHLESLQLLKLADCSIFIRDDSRSNRAGFPTKYVESVSAGTPVVANETSDVDGSIISSNGGIVVGDSSSEALLAVLDSILGSGGSPAEGLLSRNASTVFDYRNWKQPIRAFLSGLLA